MWVDELNAVPQAIGLALAACIVVVSGANGLHSVHATEVRPGAGVASPPSPETLKSLADWISAKTGWANEELPSIRIVSREALAELFHGKIDDPKPVAVEAAYAMEEHTIYLSNRWNSDSLRDTSVLLHELVHHLQITNKVEVPCREHYDLRAYDLQIEWLREQGIRGPYKFLNINEAAIFALSQCGDYWGEW